MNIITGYRGEPHITSAQDRAVNQGAYGVDSYILNVGQQLQADIISANEIRIRDGALSHQGCVANIDSGMYDSVEISNGTQGMLRRDLIVARYEKDAETNIESISLVVIEGTPSASSPATPSYNSGNIQAGDSPVDMPLYRVNISGVNISSTTRVASTIRTQAEIDTLLGNLFNTTIVKSASNTAVASGTAWSSGTTLVNSGSLSAGTYVVRGYVLFPSNATGRRYVSIATSNTGNPYNGMYDIRPAANGSSTAASVFGIFTINSNTTLYLRALQNSGSELSCDGRMEILKIH